MKTTANNNRENINAANIATRNNIQDFGAKIGGARKDMYQAAREWAEKLADITAEALTKAGGVSKLVRLPNLESMTAAGAITADQARAALIIWRGIERKPQGSYRADRWAERTRARLEAAADIITGTEPTADNVADIITAARESAEFTVISAAKWPAEPFTFGNYTVSFSLYSEPRKLRIIGGRYYRGEASTDPADIARQLREMTAADAEKAAESRARGPRLAVYNTSDYTRYFIAVENKCEIVLKVCDTYQEAAEAVRNERAELLAKYEALKSFPALRRSWNRPRIGKEWHAEDVTPEQFAAVIPFKGVEFGNWLTQDERAALLNSAFDGFHDLADLLGIPAAAVSLGGMLNFSFATRGHAGSAAHFDSCYNTINLNKRNGAGCMAHEWLHACDHFAAVLAGRGSCTSWGEAFATECNKESEHPADIAARDLIRVIKNMNYYTRSRNYQAISGKSQGGADYYTQPCELAARGFEGVVLYLLNCAGGCSDFLVNLQSWREFERDDAGHRRDCYPYPSDAEAAALVPYYVAFFRALFGACEVSQKAADGVAAATLQAAQEKAEAERRAAEKAEQERKESEERRTARRAELDRKAEEQRKENERKAAERKEKTAAAVSILRDVLTARHFDNIAIGWTNYAIYGVCHLEGEIYTISIDKGANATRADIEAAPMLARPYKYCASARRIINRADVVKCNKYRNAADLCAELARGKEGYYFAPDIIELASKWDNHATAATIEHAAKIYADTMRSHEAQKAAQNRTSSESNAESISSAAESRERKATAKPANEPTANEPTESNQESADGLRMERYSEKATVIRGYNADQLAELLAMGGKEWHRLKGGKGVIFSTRRHADELAAWMEQQQGEGTTAPAADQPADIVPATTLQEAGEISDTTNEPAAVLPEWLKVGARVRTRGRYMMSTRSTRPQWVEGEEMEITAISADFVSLKSDTARESVSTANAAADLTPIYSASEKLGEAVREWSANEYAATHHGATLTDWDKAHPAPVEWCKPGQVFKLAGRQIAGRDVYAIITKLGNDCFFYVGNFGNCSEHLTAYNCQQWENLQPVEIMHEDTPKFAKMFQKFHDIRKAWEADGVKIWQEREDKERTAAPFFDEQSGKAERQEPAAIAASIDTDEAPAEAISTPTRAKAYTYQDQLGPDTLPADLPAELLKFYEVNRDASDENPSPVCLFYEPGVEKYQAFGSDAHLLAQEFGAAVITFTQKTEYKHGKHFPAPIDFADFPAADLSARLHWLTREGYAVAVFAAADCLPTLNPAAPDWQERQEKRRALRYSETLELGDGVTRVMESVRNMYDFHYDLYYRYYKGGDLLAMFHATGYPEKWDYIGTIRPPHAGRFSNGLMVEHFATIWQAERYMLEEIAKGLQPYHKPTDPTPDPSGEGVEVCYSFETGAPCYSTSEKSEPTAGTLADIIDTAKKQEKRTISGLNFGPIEYLKNAVLYRNGEDLEKNLREYENNIKNVTDADTYAGYLLSSYDIFVDETQVFCDLRRAFPSLTFAEVCQLIRDHMGENQQGNGIAAALVPDCVILSSSDEYTRRTFAECHKKYNRRTADGCTADELRRHYDRESLTIHAILSAELFYLWEDDRAARCLESVRESYPDTTAQELRNIRDKYADAVGEIYG